MLAEHFVGNMDNGSEFTARLDWDKSSSWEWENVVMLSGHVNRKPHSSDWGEEPMLVTAPSAAAAAAVNPNFNTNGEHLNYPPDRNCLPDGKVGFPSSVVKRETAMIGNSEKAAGVIAAESNHQKDFLLGLGGAALDKGTELGKNDAGASGSQDAETGLKLGLKRSFTPDAVIPTTNANANTSNNNNTNNSNSKGPATTSSPGKKPRSAHHTPRCQVEGCRTDLSSAKDYHRRHKVCAMHSKSAKVSVNSIEQRFCQQCSRFHVLSEFDEGKRSCRRRLAGHNERRRKPQPDPMALTTAGLSPYQAGFMRLARDDRLFGYGTPLSYLGLDNLHGKLNWPRFGHLDEHHSHSTGLVSGSSSNLARPERFFMLFPPRKGPTTILNGIGNHHHHPMGQNLSLSSSGTGNYAGGINHASSSHGLTDSGRALSLLSSQSWVATPHDSMEQLMSDHKQQQQQQQQRVTPYSHQQTPASYNSSGTVSPGRHQQQQQASSYSSQAQGSLAVVVPLDGGGQSQGTSYLPGIANNYENNSVLTLLHESEFRGLQPDRHARPTIDLMMQMSTTHSGQGSSASTPVMQQQQHSNGGGGHISDFQTLKSYGSSAIYDPHQL